MIRAQFFPLQKLFLKTAAILNTEKTPFLLLIGCVLLATTVFSQQTYQMGILPSVNLNAKLKNDWALNTKIESRQLLQNGEFKGSVDKKYKYVLTDFSLIASKKVGLNSRIGAGYLIRLEGGAQIHRFIQQFIVVKRMSGYRLAHRFLSDQTFSKIETPQFRFRYRITSEIPLNGESVDPKEFYVKLNNEYLNSFQTADYDLEIRLVPLLGYDLADNNKIEMGVDYRVNSFLKRRAEHSFWVSLNWFIEIGD
jgi:hypothetical protein